MSSSSRISVALVVLAALVMPVSAQRASNDWTQWRGPSRDGAAPAVADANAWPEKLTQKWKVEVGQGYATPLVVGNRIYQFARKGEREVMMAIDADSGKVLWETGHTATFTMMPATKQHGPGPKSTPLFANGRLYSIGMTGIVTAYDAASGKQLWQKPGSTVVPMFTTHSFSPVIDRGLVVFHLGGHDEGALTAFDASTGDQRWSWKGDGPGYGSPVLADFGGTRQIVTITQGKLVGVDVATGALLWERPFVSPNNTNSNTPVVAGDLLIVSSNGPPTSALRVSKQGDKWSVETVWENADVPMRLSDAVLAGDVLFGLSTRNSGQYFGVDVKTGKTLWTSEGRQGGHAAIARAGNLLFSLEDDGELVIVQNSRTAFEPLRRYKVADVATWGQPSYSGNRVFVKDETNLTLWTTK
ncbi:MAG TPA: PQQ-binding-like beta-propeller repeat protein [Vicinamibacterales bacterium]|nr:PQQ-binding-like beta-propeller repeat protein [Vicinamibacterales bacterium]